MWWKILNILLIEEKDCSNCILPHIKEVGYAHIQKKMLEVIEIVQQEHLAKKEEK